MSNAARPFISVALNLPLERTFQYVVPPSLRPQAMIGSRVRVPFGPRLVTGVIVDRSARAAFARVREILNLMDARPLYSTEMLRLGRWLADRYYCSWGEALAAMAPPVTGRQGVAALPEALSDGPLTLAERWSHSADWNRVKPAIGTAVAHRSAQTWIVQLAPTVRPWEWLADAVALGLDSPHPVLVLVPELQHVECLRARWSAALGAGAVFLHHLSGAAERRAAWGRLLAGQARVVVGTRLAVFAPSSAFGLMILMDEHNTSFRQDDVPHYHAREVLLERARRLHAPALLVSATPSLEAWQMARARRATWVQVAWDGRALPRRHVVDLRSHQFRPSREGRERGWPLITPPLERALDATLQHQQRALLWLNRLGFATRVQCHLCGHVLQCAQCTIALVYFSRQRALRCRYCAASSPAPERCPQCRKDGLQYRGRGVEKVASEIARRFPAVPLRVYERRHAVHGTWHMADKTPQTGTEDWQVLISTEAALHGWEPPAVQLVGGITVDSALAIPDFRAAERVLQQLERTVQRVSWSGDDGGVVIAQAINPDHPALRHFAQGTLHEFYRQELALRRRYHLPPWTHLIQLIVRGAHAKRTEARARTLAAAVRNLQSGTRLTLLGPTPLVPFKRRGHYHWQIVLKGRSVAPMVRQLRRLLAEGRRWQGMPLTIDVDPL